jgi:hypothetical protein
MAGTKNNIIMGGAEIFLAPQPSGVPVAVPNWVSTASAAVGGGTWVSVGYTSEGLDLSVEPEYLDVEVDQLLDSAALFKSGQKLTISTSFTEATLDNLAFVLGQPDTDIAKYSAGATVANDDITDADAAMSAAGDYRVLTVKGGSLGSAPLIRSFYAVGPSPRGANTATKTAERVYYMPNVISQESVTVAVKRNEASQYPVTFRCLPDSGAAAGQEYGKVVDRLYGT